MVDVGEDEFCINCMQWRTYDAEGKCTKCGKTIKKQKSSDRTDGYGEKEHETSEFEDSESY